MTNPVAPREHAAHTPGTLRELVGFQPNAADSAPPDVALCRLSQSGHDGRAGGECFMDWAFVGNFDELVSDLGRNFAVDMDDALEAVNLA